MLTQVIYSLIAFITSIHASLYRPVFSSLPELRPAPLTSLDTVSVAQAKRTNVLSPFVQARAYLVIDQASGEVLASQNMDLQLFPASTTKIMTALVVLDRIDPESIASVSASPLRDGSDMGLVVGERIKVKDLLAGMLIHSANDAALTLAENYPGGVSEFVRAMNQKAQALSLTKSRFTNPVGFSESEHVMSVRDLLVLAREAMRNEIFVSFVRTQALSVKSADGKILHTFSSTNKLLGEVEGIEGIKTGWTQEAGECLVAQATRDGQTILVAILGSPDRFGETKKLIEWAFANYQNQKIRLTE